MKKYYLVVFCALLLFVVTGCGKNQVKCTGSYSEGGMNISADIIADLDKDDKVTGATVVYDLKDSKTAEQYCSVFKLAEDKEKGIEVSCSGSKITIAGFANMDDEDEEKMTGKTKEEFIKAMEEEKFTCK